MIIKTVVLFVIAAVIFVIVAAFRANKKRQPAETDVDPESPPPVVAECKKEVQELVDSHRREIETSEMSEACRELGLVVIGKVEDVTRKPTQEDVKQYCQSMKIRLEAFRAAYRGEPSTEYLCNTLKCVDLSNALIDAILKHLQKRMAEM